MSSAVSLILKKLSYTFRSLPRFLCVGLDRSELGRGSRNVGGGSTAVKAEHLRTSYFCRPGSFNAFYFTDS